MTENFTKKESNKKRSRINIVGFGWVWGGGGFGGKGVVKIVLFSLICKYIVSLLLIFKPILLSKLRRLKLKKGSEKVCASGTYSFLNRAGKVRVFGKQRKKCLTIPSKCYEF